ncbi:MAG: hypothetical protein IPG07_13435 [Crocinitomicaceae bacterium]|nr:hypothetical protein [Crocinitomicaceae bacterium]
MFDASNAIHYKDYYGRDKAQLKSVASGVTLQTVVDTYLYKTFMVTDKAAYDAKMTKIQFIQTTHKGEIAGMDGSLFMTAYRGAPNKSASITKVVSPEMTAVVSKEYFDGTAGGSFAMGQGTKKLEGDDLAKKMKPSFPYSQAYYLTDETLVVELMGIDVIDGKEYYKVKVASKGETDFGYEFYSVETGLLEREEMYTTDENGEATSMIMTYSDFKDTGSGMYVPYIMEMNAGGQIIKFTLTEMIVKKKAKSAAFTGSFD